MMGMVARWARVKGSSSASVTFPNTPISRTSSNPSINSPLPSSCAIPHIRSAAAACHGCRVPHATSPSSPCDATKDAHTGPEGSSASSPGRRCQPLRERSEVGVRWPSTERFDAGCPSGMLAGACGTKSGVPALELPPPTPCARLGGAYADAWLSESISESDSRSSSSSSRCPGWSSGITSSAMLCVHLRMLLSWCMKLSDRSPAAYSCSLNAVREGSRLKKDLDLARVAHARSRYLAGFMCA
mmetsp:Transcript_22721/g.40484  ORF Transcript_22721/g.40484 Transcript_22721/m.40484 type:complete len:243 (-) Transcript_22721:1158-1886(-)